MWKRRKRKRRFSVPASSGVTVMQEVRTSLVRNVQLTANLSWGAHVLLVLVASATSRGLEEEVGQHADDQDEHDLLEIPVDRRPVHEGVLGTLTESVAAHGEKEGDHQHDDNRNPHSSPRAHPFLLGGFRHLRTPCLSVDIHHPFFRDDDLGLSVVQLPEFETTGKRLHSSHGLHGDERHRPMNTNGGVLRKNPLPPVWNDEELPGRHRLSSPGKTRPSRKSMGSHFAAGGGNSFHHLDIQFLALVGEGLESDLLLSLRFLHASSCVDMRLSSVLLIRHEAVQNKKTHEKANDSQTGTVHELFLRCVIIADDGLEWRVVRDRGPRRHGRVRDRRSHRLSLGRPSCELLHLSQEFHFARTSVLVFLHSTPYF